MPRRCSPRSEIRIAAFLIVHINEHGILDTTLEETALACECDEETALAVLRAVQSVVPVGVAARDYRESFLLQLRACARAAWRFRTLSSRSSRSISRISPPGGSRISRTHSASTTEMVEEARAFIRSHLTPHPLQNPTTRAGRKTSETGFLTPDVLIREDAGR